MFQTDKSNHRISVNTVALWDTWLTRRPFSRWTLLPIVDTKKKIETSETFLTTSTHFSPQVSLSKYVKVFVNELCIFKLYFFPFGATFNSEKALILSCVKITNTAVEATVKCSLFCSRSDEGKFCFKLCAGSARFYAAVRDRSASPCLCMSSLTCLLWCSPISLLAGAAVIRKI